MHGYMRDMYYRKQPLSEIMNAKYSEMKMCYQWSQEIAGVELDETGKARARAAAKAAAR